jgi:transmembrane sensor
MQWLEQWHRTGGEKMMNSEENKKFEESGRILSGEDNAPKDAVDQELSAIWDLAGTYTYKNIGDTDAAWGKLQSSLTQQQPMRISWLRRNAVAVAASLALLVTAGGAGMWFFFKAGDHANGVAMHIKTGSNEIKNIRLADGSSITLNSNSEIIADNGFNAENRMVTLHGQASFEVARNEDLPFEVQAGNTHTEVLGTGFDIMAYAGEDVTILVKHGKVSFGNQNQKLTLVKGQAALYQSETGKLGMFQGDTANANWQGGEWVFKKTQLSDIATMFKHRFGKSLVYAEKDANRQFTGRFTSEASAEDIAKTLKEALAIDITIE